MFVHVCDSDRDQWMEMAPKPVPEAHTRHRCGLGADRSASVPSLAGCHQYFE